MSISNAARRIFTAMIAATVLVPVARAWAAPPQDREPPQSPTPPLTEARRAGVLELRIGSETLRNPYWYAENGREEEARQFWDKKNWDRVFERWAGEEYNAILYWVEPWNKHAWQTFLIRHKEFPEAR